MKTAAVEKAVEKTAAPFLGREQLAAAHRARREAEAALERAKATLEKATLAVADATSDLEKFDDLNDRISSGRAALLKQGKTQSPLPNNLIAERNARTAARERLEETKGALTLLEVEHKNAEKALRKAVENHGHQAFLILMEEATDLSKKLAVDQQRVWEMHDRLKAFDHFSGATHVPTDGARHAAMHSKACLNLIAPLTAQPRLAVAYSPADPVRAAVEVWKAKHAALLNDANAPIGSV